MKRIFLAVLALVAAATAQTVVTGGGGGVSTAAGVVALFSTCSGTQYLGADGICHTAAGSGTVTHTPGALTANQIVIGNGGADIGPMAGTLIDTSTDASGANRTLLAPSNTWTAGNASFSEHTLDLGCTSQATATSTNTLACAYLTMMNKNSSGVMGHPLGLAVRFSDNSTSTATIGLSMDGLYVEANNAAGITGVGTIPEINDINLANATLSSASQIISNFNGLKYSGPTLGANTVITKETGAAMGPIRGTTSQVLTSHLINAGNCTHSLVYLPFIACGGLSEFQGPVLITGMTMDGTTSPVPQTVTQPYILKFNNFHSGGTSAEVNMLLTTGNAATGTTVGIKNIIDLGGSSGNMTLTSEFQGQISGTGAATSTRSIVYDILASAVSGAVTTAIGYHAAAIKGLNVATGYAFWSEGTSDFNRFDGQVGIHKIPTTTSTLAIAGLPTSSAGLVTGDVWANANVLTIIP